MREAIDLAIVIAYYAILLLLTIYGLHRVHLLRLLRKVRDVNPGQWVSRARGTVDRSTLDAWPSVTVQLPVYNEPNVAARLVDAAAMLDYPGRLDIQLLDDSTDRTTEIIAERVLHWRKRGISIKHVRRGSRDGFKAGALAEGMKRSTSDFFLIFDADFVPPKDVLTRMMPAFADERVGMVQARWGHLNRDDSLLTRVQAIYLDSHFAIESAGRYAGRRFFNFNGTAGVWRRQAIVDAGGWSSSTLTEDLDLSYRAQLAGWEFVFLSDVAVPAELPSTISGFQGQQHRWVKGSIQTARKILADIFRARIARHQKIESFFHLTNNVAYLLTLMLALLLVPAVQIRYARGLSPMLWIDGALFLLSSASLIAFYLEGQKRVGERRPTLRELLSIVPLGVGMSVRNSAAVMEGLFENGGDFARTPKRGTAPGAGPTERLAVPAGESVLAIFYLFAAVAFVSQRYYFALPFLALFLAGYLYIVLRAVLEFAVIPSGHDT